MGQQIYEWMKNLAVFYIFLTAVTHLVPDGRYEEYIRFFMGLLLMLILLSPLFKLVNLKDSVQTLIDQYVQEEQNLELEMRDVLILDSSLEDDLKQETLGEGE